MDIDDEYEKKKFEDLKAEFEPLTKLMKEVLGDKTEKVEMAKILDENTAKSDQVDIEKGEK